MIRVIGCIAYEHDPWLIALAACICVMACFTATNLAARAGSARNSAWMAWLIAAGLIFGCGVWSLHFIAMLAFLPAVPIAYDILDTAASVAVASGGAALALLTWRAIRRRAAAAAAGGTLLGLSVGGMHYLGVAGMELRGHVHLDRDLVAASLIVAVVFASVALYRAADLSTYWRRAEVAGWLALCVCGVHFTGMAAIAIEPGGAAIGPHAILGTKTLAVVVGSVSLAILAIGLAATLMEQHLAHRAALERKRMQLSDISREALIVHRDGIVLQANAAAGRLFGAAPGDLAARDVFQLIAEDDRPLAMALESRPDPGQDITEIQVRDVTGQTIPVELYHGTVEYDDRRASVWALRDMSERKRDEARLLHMARYDPLTGLPNRRLFQERLNQALANAARGEPFAVHCLDLDHFQQINDTLGHDTGDALLRLVAARLLSRVGDADTVARLGGDEFAILQTRIHGPDSAARLARSILEDGARTVEIAGHELMARSSIGIVLAPEHGRNAGTLMKNADMALYAAKVERGCFRFFLPSMGETLRHRRAMELDLHHAIADNGFELYYQPLLTLDGGRIVAFEALIRWHHPEFGLIQPNSFIALAEETGQIVPIGEWVLTRACQEAMTWPEPIKVAVNLSPVQLRGGLLHETVVRALAISGLPASRLELEITESSFLNDDDTTLETLHGIRALGVGFSMDDFGTGYSSLGYLYKFPFGKIKIDRSFVARSTGAAGVIRAITGLGRSLGMATVAEGIETAEQLRLLRLEGCTEGQGYLFSPPVPGSKARALLDRINGGSLAAAM